MSEMLPALVIGAGPAGLMAAEMMADAGQHVVVAEAKPSSGRKFLMAGKSGLNLTKDEPTAEFQLHYAEASHWLSPVLRDFGPAEVQAWARDLGQDVFTGSSGRVFPTAMKASPLLRAWLIRLREKGVEIRMRWRWIGFDGADLVFDVAGERRTLSPERTVLALGGASWARLGSDGSWAPFLAARGVRLSPFEPSNVGYSIDWSDHMRPHLGAPVKSIELTAGDLTLRGEVVISTRGLEGGGIYALSRALRDGAELRMDLFPDWTEARIAERLAGRPRRESQANRLRKALGLQGARLSLVQEWLRPLPADPLTLARHLKNLSVPLGAARPMDEAISTAGGIHRDALDQRLMLRKLPGIFAAGEMLDWDAPTGGYLVTACLATGRWAGREAAGWASP